MSLFKSLENAVDNGFYLGYIRPSKIGIDIDLEDPE